MASLFAHNRILPNLKRRTRSSSKSDASSTKAKPLHILPNLAEEDELPRHSCSSTSSVPSASHPSRFASGCATVGGRPSVDQVIHIKRDSRRVVLTGVEGLSFDDFFPPSSAPRVRTPSPPPMTRSPSPPPRSTTSSPGSDSPLDDINLRFSGLGISLDFPSPPSASIRTSSRSFSRRREQSPTPSNASSESSSSYSSPKTPCTTPPTSDDESPCKSNLARAPTFKSQRASILFMKSMPDLAEPVRKSSFSSIVDDDSIMEELEWIARDISEVVTLSTPLPPTFPTTPTEASMNVNARARPDSVMPLARRESHLGRAVPPVPRISIQDSSERQRPSAQLDPTFPLRRRSYMVPTRPPPPPPVPTSPISSMEQATEDLLAELANAALGAGFLGTELTVPQDGFLSAESLPPTPSSQFIVTSPSGLRPLPRFSVPDDINDFGDESPVELVVPDLTSHMWPTTPQTPQSISVYSQMSEYSPPTSPLSSFDFEVDVSHVLSHREEAAAALECASTISRSPSTVSLVPSERPLRSRWSSSTLGSLVEGSSHSNSWLPRFNLSPSKKNKTKPVPAPAHTAGPLQRKNAVKAGHGAKRSVDSDRGLTRRDSRASRMSESSASDSGESTTSSGLKRKPIPMALLATSA
ncbi:hypothetical protein TRAPUB_814 [Trametes pubescens]|uniref:Uncharacterized protein n=1 Tax=Trametes pubescens TaxID=154538 RepID=A0A1M2VKZ8_TRAPU|nr:hypothetical protein TRAPUB_814 [Trametes pubescens]